MARVRDLLFRFRPAGAPGAASAAGVPVDRRADVAAELDSVFEQLERTERACAAIRDQGTRDAAAARVHEAERARGLVKEATARVATERAAATAAMRQQAEIESAELLAAAEQEAADVRARAAQRMPDYVEQVVACVRRLLGDDRGAAA